MGYVVIIWAGGTTVSAHHKRELITQPKAAKRAFSNWFAGPL